MPIQAKIEALIDRYVDAYNRHDLSAIGTLYTEAASLYSSYARAAVGHPAVMEAHKDMFEANEQNKRLSLIHAEADGDLAYCVIRYAGDFPDEAGNLITETGISMNVLKRRGEGHWQIHVTSLTSDTPTHA